MKKKIIIITSIAVATTLGIIGIIFGVWYYNKSKQTTSNSEDVIEFSDIFYDNGWNKSYISEIIDDVAIPVGYEYVQGDKQTGLIIKDQSNNYYVWIPYHKDATSGQVDEYFKNINKGEGIEYNAYVSMDLYGGFYLELTETEETIDKLKSLDEVAYNQARENMEARDEDGSIVNKHLISKTELEQVLYFMENLNTNNSKLSKVAYKGEDVHVEKLTNNGEFFNTTDEGEIKEFGENAKYYGLTVLNIDGWTKEVGVRNYSLMQHTEIHYEEKETGERHIVYLPDGFDISPKNGIFRIKSKTNPDLVYVWVSTEKLGINNSESVGKTVREYLFDVLSKYNRDNPDANVEYVFEGEEGTQLNPEIEYSIKKFNGFYMAENETWYNENGEIATRIVAQSEYKIDSEGSDYVRLDIEAGSDISSIFKYANTIPKQVGGDNVIPAIAPIVAHEAVAANRMSPQNKEDEKKGYSEEGVKEYFVDGTKENGKDVITNPSEINIDEYPNEKGIYNHNGSQQEFSGEQRKESTDAQPILGNDETTIITKGTDFNASNDTQKGGNSSMNVYNEKLFQDEVKKRQGTIGVRLCIFLSDINRHADYFNIDDNGYITLKNINNAPENLVIPAKVGDKVVHGVSSLSGCTKIKTVNDRISKNVLSNTYKGCTNLEEIKLGLIDGNIEERAFEGCKLLRNVEMFTTDSAEIKRYAFAGCEKLEQVATTYTSIEQIEISSEPSKKIYHLDEELDLTRRKTKDNI